MGGTIGKGVGRSVGEKKFLLGLGVAYRERGDVRQRGEPREGKKNNHEQKELCFPIPSESEVGLET